MILIEYLSLPTTIRLRNMYVETGPLRFYEQPPLLSFINNDDGIRKAYEVARFLSVVQAWVQAWVYY